MILTFCPAVVFALADAGIMVPAMYASTDGRPVIIRVATLTIVRFCCFIIGGATLCAMKPHGTAGIAFMILRNQPLRLTGQCRLTHGRNAGMGAFDFANRAAYLVALSAAPCAAVIFRMAAGKAADAALAVCTRAAPRAAPVRFLMVAGQLADAALAGRSVILPFPCAIFAIFMVAALTASLTLSGGVIPLL